MATTFKSYSEKSKARRALVQVYSIPKDDTDAYLSTAEGKWGFLLNGDTPEYHTKPESMLEVQYPKSSEFLAVIGAPAELVQAMQEVEQQDEVSVTAAAPSPAAFTGFAMSQLSPDASTAAAAPAAPVAPAKRESGLKIQKNREMRNGINMPSVGGRCRAVWDALSNLMVHDEATGTASIPTVADIRKHAESKGWNVNNASIEYYQWRKFYGITGRNNKTI